MGIKLDTLKFHPSISEIDNYFIVDVLLLSIEPGSGSLEDHNLPQKDDIEAVREVA